jgi:hypothetical protein
VAVERIERRLRNLEGLLETCEALMSRSNGAKEELQRLPPDGAASALACDLMASLLRGMHLVRGLCATSFLATCCGTVHKNTDAAPCAHEAQ